MKLLMFKISIFMFSLIPLNLMPGKMIFKSCLFEEILRHAIDKEYCIFNEPYLSLSQSACIYLPRIKKYISETSIFSLVIAQNFIRFEGIAHGEIRHFLEVLMDIKN